MDSFQRNQFHSQEGNFTKSAGKTIRHGNVEPLVRGLAFLSLTWHIFRIRIIVICLIDALWGLNEITYPKTWPSI
jgi:hypothetical protein